MHRLGSFLNMIRIASIAINCSNGVCFCSAVFEKSPCKLEHILTPKELEGQVWSPSEVLNFINVRVKISVLNSSSNVDSEYVYFMWCFLRFSC